MNSESTDGSGMIEFLAWLEVNKKRLAIGAVVVLVVGFGIYLYNHFAEQKEMDASAALVLLRPTGPSTNEVPVPASAYLKLAEQHPGTAAAERAMLLAASALFGEGKYADAQAHFEGLLKDHPSSAWAADAAYGIAASVEAQGKRDDAVAAYLRVVTGFGTSAVVPDARLALARIYEAKNQPAEALKQYDDVTRTAAMTMRGQEAMMRRGQLMKSHPELEKPATNALPTMAPATLPAATNRPSAAAPSTNKAASATTNAAAASKK